MTEKNDVYYMKKALLEAEKAAKINEIPVGTIIVLNGKIVSRAYNLRDTKKIVTNHAEIMAIEKANKKLKNWRLNECVLYTTLQPCLMCLEVIKNSKLKKVIYAAKSNERKFNSDIEEQITDEQLTNQSSSLIRKVFKKIRNEKSDS